MDYTAVIFCAHLVAVKCEVFTTTSTREIQLCARPATQLMCSTLLPADFTRQSIAHARKSKRKGSIPRNEITLVIACRTLCAGWLSLNVIYLMNVICQQHSTLLCFPVPFFLALVTAGLTVTVPAVSSPFLTGRMFVRRTYFGQFDKLWFVF